MDRLRIVAFGYRQWALNIFTRLQVLPYFITTTIYTRSEDVTLENLEVECADLVLFYGWSWMVPDEIVEKYTCLCLHPSPLPKYRGGSPIQNQILDGNMESALSIFRMTPDMDAGDLCAQDSLSLDKNISNIFDDMTEIGYSQTVRLIDQMRKDGIKYWPQEGEPTYCERRTPAASEITFQELNLESARCLHNKIRCLQDPYPNAFITCADGKKLYITEAHVD